MPSTYTINGGIIKPATGENDGTWGDLVNTNSDILDRMINGVVTVTLSGSTYTLTTSDGVLSEGHGHVIVLSGSPSTTVTVTIAPNDAQHVYFFRNVCGKQVTLTQGSGGNITISNNQVKVVYCDGAGATAAVVDLTARFAQSNVTITGGSIDSTSIGATTPATGKFTTLQATGATTLSSTLGVIGATTLTGALVADTDSLVVDVVNHRVGVGVTTPSTKFEVAGGMRSTSSTVALGYGTGAGGTVTQLTSKSTTVVILNTCGQITTHNASLASGAVVFFTVANTSVSSTDVIIVNVQSPNGKYEAFVSEVNTAYFQIGLRNTTGGALSEAVVINYAVINSVSS